MAMWTPSTQQVTLIAGFDGTEAQPFRTDTSGNQTNVGNVASGAADSGNPVKVAGRYNATKPTLADGQRGDLQLGSRGALDVTIRGNDNVTGTAVASSAADAAAYADGGAALLVQAAAVRVFNGSTYDRLGKVTATARLLSAAASTNATVVKASAGNLFKIVGTNVNAAARYLKLYNKATAPTVGTDTPVWTFYLPPTAVNGGQFELSFESQPLYFATGIGYALTTAAADADTGALTAGDVVAMNIGYS